jgi:hypothetical protein
VPNYFTKSLAYEERLPPETLYLTIDRASFGAYGLSNSEGETVSIYTPDTVLVSSWTYSVPNEDGFSEEKKIIEFADCEENWDDSSVFGGTPGAVNSNTPPIRDVAILHCEIGSSLPVPTKRDSLNVILMVQNAGRSTIRELFVEIHRTGVMVLSRKVTLDSLAWNDTAFLEFDLPPMPPGQNALVFRIRLVGDENETNDTIHRNFAVRADPGDIVINEVLFYTETGDQEWIELYNPTVLTIDLAGWRIRDRGKYAVLTAEAFPLRSLSYVVVGRRPIPVPDGAKNLICPLLPELNNSSDMIVLFDATSAVIDSFGYTASGESLQRLRSLERVRYEDPAWEKSNWAGCRDTSGSTPGRLNSVSPRSYDLELKHLELSPRYPEQGESCGLEAVISNSGRSPMGDIRIDFFVSNHSIGQLQPIGEGIVAGQLSPRTQRTVFLEWSSPPPGKHTVWAVLYHGMDLVARNDSAWVYCTVSYTHGAVVCNEIMYRPAGGSCEWIELYNTRPYGVNIADWVLSGSDTTRGYRLSDTTLFIDPWQFLVVSEDSSIYKTETDFPCIVDSRFPALSDTRDSLFVYDGNGRLIECIRYNSSWGGRIGRSIERINPHVASSVATNWSTCVSAVGHTLGETNSIHTEVLPARASFSVSPNPFSPDFDGFEDMLAIELKLPVETSSVNIRIFDSKGRMVRFLRNNEPSGSSMTLFWDGLDDRGQKCRIGIYILSLKAFDFSRCEIHRGWQTVVLAGQL